MNHKNFSEARKRAVGRPSEQESANLKDQILKAYFEICNREGIENVTLQKVADQSGVALTSVRYHFQMKGFSLSQAAMAYVSDKTYEWIDAGLLKARAEPGFDPVMAYMDVQLEWLTQQPLQASFLFYYYYLCTTEVPTTIGNQELIEIAHRRILGFLHEGLGMKIYSFTKDPMELAKEIQMIVMGAAFTMITSRNPEFAQTQRQISVELVKALLRK